MAYYLTFKMAFGCSGLEYGRNDDLKLKSSFAFQWQNESKNKIINFRWTIFKFLTFYSRPILLTFFFTICAYICVHLRNYVTIASD